MSNNENIYCCDTTFENYFSSLDDSLKFSKTISSLINIFSEYENFVATLESFFNSQIENEDDYNELKGDVFELSDVTERVYFPFKKVDGQLKFVETDIWRLAIMTAIASSKLDKTNKDTRGIKNEQLIPSEF